MGIYLIWSYLPKETDAEILLAEAKKHQVGFQPGIRFSSVNGLCNYLRFCFNYYGEKKLVEGVERLCE